jgi:hypothetical protein
MVEQHEPYTVILLQRVEVDGRGHCSCQENLRYSSRVGSFRPNQSGEARRIGVKAKANLCIVLVVFTPLGIDKPV